MDSAINGISSCSIRSQRTIHLGAFVVLSFLILCCAFAFPTHALAEDFSGANRYDTAAREARAAYPYGAKTAIIVTGESWSDALSATGLAGCLDAPILFTPPEELSDYTVWAINDLSISSLIIIGNTSAVSTAVEEALAGIGRVESVERIAGVDALDTQMEVFQYGLDHALWSNERIIITSGEVFADALSASPVAFVSRSPIFLTFGGVLSEEQELALIDNSFNEIIVLGGTSAVSDQTYGYLTAASLRNTGATDRIIRLAGNNRWETSALIAQWATWRGILSWNNAALTTGHKPFDAIAGSTLQGKRRAVLLLADSIYDPTINDLINNRYSVSQISFFGDDNTYSLSQRNYIRSHLGIYIPYADVWTACFFQYPELPTGCEAVALTNALSHYGFSLSKYTIVDHYLPFSTWDFVSCYVGDPYINYGAWNSCCAPALVRAANDYLYDADSSLRAYEITGTSFNDLYTYIERGYPVVVWNTIGMEGPGGVWASQDYNGHTYSLYSGTHTVVLRGFDREQGTVMIADSIDGYVTRDAGTFGWIYSYLGAQAVVIM